MRKMRTITPLDATIRPGGPQGNVEFQTQLYRPVYIQLETRDPKSEKFVAIPIDFLLKKLNLHECI